MLGFQITRLSLTKWLPGLRRTGSKAGQDDPALHGTSFLAHEPDLVKESGLYTRQVSGWAMGGSLPIAD
jgi:hypothetical protein